MPQKRKSRGRAKGSKGRAEYIQCSSCNRMVPQDKAKKVTVYRSLVDSALVKELRTQGAYFSRQKTEKYYCVSCAVHRGVVKVRSKILRKGSF